MAAAVPESTAKPAKVAAPPAPEPKPAAEAPAPGGDGDRLFASPLVRNWAVEFASPNGLYRRGWRQTDLPPRNTVTVTGYPSLDKSPRISATDVKLPDGRTLFAGSPPTGGQ